MRISNWCCQGGSVLLVGPALMTVHVIMMSFFANSRVLPS
jgi:hypothetical protein